MLESDCCYQVRDWTPGQMSLDKNFFRMVSRDSKDVCKSHVKDPWGFVVAIVMRHSDAVMILRFWCHKFVLPVGRSGMTKGWRSALGTEFKTHPWRETVGRYPASGCFRDLQQGQKVWKWMKHFSVSWLFLGFFHFCMTCYLFSRILVSQVGSWLHYRARPWLKQWTNCRGITDCCPAMQTR